MGGNNIGTLLNNLKLIDSGCVHDLHCFYCKKEKLLFSKSVHLYQKNYSTIFHIYIQSTLPNL